MIQPDWIFHANLGDATPLEYGGFFVYIDGTLKYQPEAEAYFPDDHIAYRFSLDKLEVWAGHLIPNNFTRKALSLPLDHYVEWFDKHLPSIASSVGMDENELRQMFTSDDVDVRAAAYRYVGDVIGYINLDSDPLRLTPDEAAERYKTELSLLRKPAAVC